MKFRLVNADASGRRRDNDREQHCEQEPFAHGHDRCPSHTNEPCQVTGYNLAPFIVAGGVPGMSRIVGNPKTTTELGAGPDGAIPIPQKDKGYSRRSIEEAIDRLELSKKQ